MHILDIESGQEIQVEIVSGVTRDMPLKKDGWNFNWRSTLRRKGTRTYVLRKYLKPADIEGVVQLRESEGMLIMDLLEIALHNIGTGKKKYERVAGILIAFACRESFRLENNYKGFLTFYSKSELVELYKEKYGARQALGQRMYIDPEVGIKLIREYLED